MLLKVNVLNSMKKLFNEIYNIDLRLDYMIRHTLFKIFKESKCMLMNSENIFSWIIATFGAKTAFYKPHCQASMQLFLYTGDIGFSINISFAINSLKSFDTSH